MSNKLRIEGCKVLTKMIFFSNLKVVKTLIITQTRLIKGKYSKFQLIIQIIDEKAEGQNHL